MQVGEGAPDDPRLGAQSGAMLGAASCDLGLRTEVPDWAAVLVVVVVAIGENEVRAAPGEAPLAPYRRHRFEQGNELVTSLRLPPVSATASGVSVASVIR